VPDSPRLIVIVKLRPFDASAWQRLLSAYANALYNQYRQEQPQPKLTAGEGGRP
jgi:hypothetical protein